MKLSRIGLKARIGTSSNLLIFLRSRLFFKSVRWGISQGAQFSTSIAASAIRRTALGRGYRYTLSRTVRRDGVENRNSRLPKPKGNDSQVQLVPLLRRLAETLEHKPNNKSINQKHQHLLRNLALRIQGLANKRNTSVVTAATLKRRRNGKYIPKIRYIGSDARAWGWRRTLEHFPKTRSHGNDAWAWGWRRNVKHILKIRSRGSDAQVRGRRAVRVRRVKIETGARIKRFWVGGSAQENGLPAHQKHEASREVQGSASGSIQKSQEVDVTTGTSPPMWAPRVRRLLIRAEHQGLLQLHMNLEDFHSSPASEEQTRSEDDSHNSSGMSKLDSEEDQASVGVTPTTTDKRLSNLKILAGYIKLQVRKIRLTPQKYDILLLQVFDDQAMHFLHKLGYDVEDVVAWAWILRASSNYDATLRLLLWTNRSMPAPRVPASIFRFLLERDIVEPMVVRLLTVHFWHRLTNRIDSSWEELYRKFSPGSMLSHQEPKQQEEDEAHSANYRALDSQYNLRLGAYGMRLIDLAATSIPALLPNLATMLCEHFRPWRSPHSTREDGLSNQATIHLTTQFNSILKKLATKTLEPYQTVPYQERAQFIVIQRMNEYQPPLILGRTAYKAVISVQLRHRKTVKERVWAELKSRAWPPYREDKIGMDAKKKDEVYGISRAQQAIRNLKEAGYAAKAWEDSASVLSGWDVNQSPTIQTRRVLSLGNIRDQSQLADSSRLWESRILSTRTVEESWAAFLNYMEEDIPRTEEVFLVMFQKIAAERDRKQASESTWDAKTADALAGDMPEVFPSSPNPRDMVYTPSPPPSYEDFYHQYRAQFPSISTKALCFLLPNAESLEQGYDYIQTSSLSDGEKDVLLRHHMPEEPTKFKFSTGVLIAYIRLLSKFGSYPLPNDDRISALSHAVILVCSVRPIIRGPWLYLLRALDSEIRRSRRKELWNRNWNIVADLLKKMESTGVSHDSHTFISVCSIFAQLLRSASQESGDDHYDTINATADPFSDLLKDTAQLLKRIFSNLVSFNRNFLGNTKQMSFLPFDRPELAPLKASTQSNGALFLPQLLYAPSPPAIHSFVRLLGSLGDRKGVVDLLKWMSFFDPELQVKVTGLVGGPKHFRSIIIAVRIIVESPSRPFMSRTDLGRMTDPESEYAISAKSIVEKMESWGGWPGDEETVEYMFSGSVSGRAESI